MADTIDVKVNGQVYSQWKEVEITKDLEAIAGAYNLVLTTPSVFTLINGSPINIEIAGKSIISGFIETVSFASGDNANDMTLRGRDRTGDLVDCSIVSTSSEFLNISFKNFCELVCKPFGIKVTTKTAKANTIISKISLQQGSAFEEMEREARKLGIFLHSDYTGNLVLDEIGTEILLTRLTTPGNILSYQASLDYSDRHSNYIVKGQQSSKANLSVAQQVRVSAKATDNNIERYRPLIIIANGATTAQQAQSLVEYEAAVRSGRSETINITVNGWTDQSGNVWEPNKIIAVDINPLKFSNHMLIKTVVMRYSTTAGQITELTLTDPDEFKPKPVIPKKQKGKKSILPA
jgi:prophage tail gpP-like protein